MNRSSDPIHVSTDDASRARTTYRAARLIDGTSPEPIDDGCVVVENGTIAYAGPFARAAAEAGDLGAVIDLGEACLLPGLIDAHVHLVWSASRAPHEVVAAEPRSMTVLRTAANARAHLRCGVTTVRDVGSTDAIAIDVSRAIEAGVAEGARIVAAGRAIVMTGGHAWWLGREVDGPEAVRRAVREELKAGARCIKLMASGGVYGHRESIGSPQLTVEELRSAVDTAHAAGVPTTAHAYSEAAIQNALDAGIDAVEHASFLSERQAREMSARGVYVVPTLSVYRAMSSRADELGLPDYIRAKTAQVLGGSEAAFRLALEHGVPIAAGTDAGSPGHPHAGAVASELEAMVEAGATAMQALRFATASAAELLRVSDQTGTIEPGKAADIAVAVGDPSRDIGRLRDVVLVLKDGTPVWPANVVGGQPPNVQARELVAP